jgi:hypothetical protein
MRLTKKDAANALASSRLSIYTGSIADSSEIGHKVSASVAAKDAIKARHEHLLLLDVSHTSIAIERQNKLLQMIEK